MEQIAEKLGDVYQELLNLPENMHGEIIDGELHVQPRPAPKHALASSYLGSDLVGPYGKGRGGPGGWWIIDEPEIHLGSDVFVPDIAGWKKERMPLLPKTAYFDLSPDWICEVISQSTARKDRVLKMPLYAKNKVQYIWLIEPTTQILEAYQLEGQYWKLIGTFAEGDKVSIAPFSEISIDLSFLWEATDESQ
jgi:Uma2 family endonuclease